MRVLLFLTLIYGLTACSPFYVSTVGHGNLRTAKSVNFCDLQNFNGKLIKTTCIYSGYEEYWSAKGIDTCRIDGTVNLNFDNYYDSWKDILIEHRMNKLHSKYWKYDARVTVKGIFTTDPNGFGHLNTSPSEIDIKSFKMKIIKKRVRKMNTTANKS